MAFDIQFYRTVDGKSPIEDFLDSLDSKNARKVTWVLRLIEDMERIPDKYFKKLSGTDDLWEVRVLSQVGYIRILGFIEGRNVWLTHGIIKKTAKVPLPDIERADRYRKDHYSRRDSL